jgi:hypothetical protein
MSESDPGDMIDMPLQFSDLQRRVITELRKIETVEFPLCNWYIGAIYALANKNNPDRHSQAAQSLRELVEKLPRLNKRADKQEIRPDFKKMRGAIQVRMNKDRERYQQIWLDKIIDNELDGTLLQITNYLSANNSPDRLEQIDAALRKYDPLTEVLGEHIRQLKRQILKNIWKKLEAFAHHKTVISEEAFNKCVNDLEAIILDILAPVTDKDQKELLSLLSKDLTNDVFSQIDILIKKRGSNFIFFFLKAENTLLLPYLESAKYFDNPSTLIKLDNGNTHFPVWHPILYLKRIAEKEPGKVVSIIKQFKTINNPIILMEICEIAASLDSIEQSLELKQFVYQLVNLNSPWANVETFISLINKWTDAESIKLAKLLIECVPDPELINKRNRRKEAHDEYSTLLNPTFKFDVWHYQQILDNGIKPLSLKVPVNTALMLVDCVKKMIESKFHLDNSSNDYSEIWCTRLDAPSEYPDNDELLVLALTSACSQVFEREPQFIASLNDVLIMHRWQIFKRLRQNLYAKHPTETTLPWIRNLILEHKDYANSAVHFELQQMIRSACVKFGSELLSEDERGKIFDAILSGPSKSEFQETQGDKYTEEGYQKGQSFFHLKQLKPFENILFGKYLDRYQELITDESIIISEDDYSPYKSVRGGFISKQSPIQEDDLAELDDASLLKYINEWQNEHRDPNNWLVEIDISALADAFKTIFIKDILISEERLNFWIINIEQIKRPIYVRVIVNAFAEQFQTYEYTHIEKALVVCRWIVSHQDSAEETETKSSEESIEAPDWGRARAAACYLIDTCLSKDTPAPIDSRDQILSILWSLATHYDQRLDRYQPVIVSQRNPLTEAINSTRSRALEDLINYGYWLRQHERETDFSDIFNVFETRLLGEPQYKFTIPEHALLGCNFGRLAGLDEARTKALKDYIFPKDQPDAWSAAFGTLLRYSQPNKRLFKIMQDDYRHAIDYIAKFENAYDNEHDWTDALGQHLFSYALWNVYHLSGAYSLLDQFYQTTANNPARWARLFEHVGRSFKNAGPKVDDKLIIRVYEFVDWRLKQASDIELKDFSFWLGAECLDAKWRLETFCKMLDISRSKDMAIYIQIEELNKMLPEHTPIVVECFAKLLQGISSLDFIYIKVDSAKPILAAGLNHADETVKGFAEQARESLLRAGHFEFIDVD